MRKIWITEIPSSYDESIFQEYCAKVDAERLAQVLRIGPEQSRMRSLLAGYLLQCAVKAVLAPESNEIGSVEAPLPLTYRYGEFGKPYLKPYPDIFFNLSHSGRFAVCGVDNREIGADIQEETPVKDRLVKDRLVKDRLVKDRLVKDRLAERFFTPEEYRQLQAVTDEKAKQRLFFRFWAVKESYIKLTGRGMGQGLDTFGIDWEKGEINDFTHHKQAYFETWEVAPGVHLAVCGTESKESGSRVRLVRTICDRVNKTNPVPEEK